MTFLATALCLGFAAVVADEPKNLHQVRQLAFQRAAGSSGLSDNLTGRRSGDASSGGESESPKDVTSSSDEGETEMDVAIGVEAESKGTTHPAVAPDLAGRRSDDYSIDSEDHNDMSDTSSDDSESDGEMAEAGTESDVDVTTSTGSSTENLAGRRSGDNPSDSEENDDIADSTPSDETDSGSEGGGVMGAGAERRRSTKSAGAADLARRRSGNDLWDSGADEDTPESSSDEIASEGDAMESSDGSESKRAKATEATSFVVSASSADQVHHWQSTGQNGRRVLAGFPTPRRADDAEEDDGDSGSSSENDDESEGSGEGGAHHTEAVIAGSVLGVLGLGMAGSVAYGRLSNKRRGNVIAASKVAARGTEAGCPMVAADADTDQRQNSLLGMLQPRDPRQVRQSNAGVGGTDPAHAIAGIV